MECNICLNVIDSQQNKTLSCEHSFCKQCIAKWETKSNSCPCCRAKIEDKLCTLCKYGCLECLPSLKTVTNNIDECIQTGRHDSLRDSLNLLDMYMNLSRL